MLDIKVSVGTTQLHCGAMKPALGNMWVNEHCTVPIKLYLKTLNFEFHMIFTFIKYYFVCVYFLFQIYKNFEIILSSQAVQNQAADRISLQT